MSRCEQAVRSLVLGKWTDYRAVLPHASVEFLRRDEHRPPIMAEVVEGGERGDRV